MRPKARAFFLSPFRSPTPEVWVEGPSGSQGQGGRPRRQLRRGLAMTPYRGGAHCPVGPGSARTEQKGAGGWREGLPWLALLPVLRCSMAHGAPPENLNTPGHTAGDASGQGHHHWTSLPDLGPIGQGGGGQGRRRRRLGLFRSSFGPWPFYVYYFSLRRSLFSPPPGGPRPFALLGTNQA